MDLEQLVDASLKYQAQKPLADAELHLLFAAASSPGGARPKALIRTSPSDQWTAKFPSANDTFQMVPIEAATLALALAAGITVPDFRIETCGKHQVLLVKRFDTTPHNGRRHMISFQTLLQAEGYNTLGYTDLFTALRKITAKPRTDIPALFRQMVFNALIGNTEDHLKNFCLLHDDEGYRLSPAYDLLPDTADRREHVLHFDPDFIYPGRKQLIKIGKRDRVPSPEAAVDEIEAVVSGWEDEFIRCGVGKDDRDRLAPGIEKRLSDSK